MFKPVSLSLAAGAIAIVFAAIQTPSALLKSHVDKLKAAQSLTATITSQPVGGAAETHVLTVSKPNFVRWETPAMIVVSDGKTVTRFDKASKTYSEEAVTDAAGSLLSSDALWAWTAFFDEKFGEQLSAAKAGKARRLKTGPVTEVIAAMTKRGGAPITIFMDDKLQIARGAVIKSQAPNGPDVIVTAEKLEIGDAPADAKLFAFVPPSDAKKVAKIVAAAGSVKWADVNAILMGNCVGCHGTQRQNSGLNVSTYDDLMRGGRGGKVIEPGNASASRILNHLRGQGSPVMPPGRPMPKATVDKIEAWINAGAKNE